MTVDELKEYQKLKLQVDIFESDLGFSYLGAVDTTKPSVQSGKISNPTESVGLKRCEADFADEYKKTKSRFENLKKYLKQIDDTEVKTIAMLLAIKQKSFGEIGEMMNYSRTTECYNMHIKYML